MATILTKASEKLFIEYANDAGNWSGMPLVGGNVRGSKARNGNLTDLKLKGLITTWEEEREGLNGRPRTPLVWLSFTLAGIAYAATLGIDLGWIEVCIGHDEATGRANYGPASILLDRSSGVRA